MKILFITEIKTGTAKVRTLLPAKFLKERGHSIQILSNKKQLDSIDIPDCVVFSNSYMIPLQDMGNVIRFFKTIKKRIIYDTDDGLDFVEADNPNFASHLAAADTVAILAKNAYKVTVTTPKLAQHMKFYNKNVTVLPNCLDLNEWKDKKPEHSKLRIGWQGAAGHFEDIASVLNVIADLQKKYDFEFVIFGITPLKSFREFYDHNKNVNSGFESSRLGIGLKNMIKRLDDIKYEFHPYVSLDEHPKKLISLGFDIGICPLLKSPFNQFKSCIKFYEYAMSGTVTMASDVLPYNAEVGYLASNNYWDWKNKLEKLITDKNLRENLLEKQKEFVVKNRDISTQIINWEKAYELKKD